ncbi:MAG TPA: nuclear transport factor 2 family protein [Puia sp.]
MKQKKFFRTFIYACFLLACTFRLHAQTDDRPRLIALEKRRIEAMTHRDTTLLSGLLADSLIYIHSSGVIDNKPSFLKDIASGRIVYLFILPEKVTASIDGNYAWIYGRANVRFKLASMIGTIDQYISFVEVYQHKRYQWQLVLCHNSRIDSNAPYFNNTVPQVKAGEVPSIY